MQMILARLNGNNFRQFGLLGLIIFAFFGWLATAGSSLGAIILVFGILLNIASFLRSMYRQPLFWLSLLAISFILLHWFLKKPLDDQSARYAARFSIALIYLWLFPFIAWYLSGRQDIARWLVGLAAVGLCIHVLLVTDWQDLSNFIRQRQRYGFSVAGAALLSALSIWGLAFYSTFVYRKYNGWIKWCVVIIASLGIALLGEALLLTQSRAGWVTLMVSLIFTGVLFVSRDGATLKSANKIRLMIVAVMVAVLLSGLLAANYTKLSNRVLQDIGDYKTLLSFDRSKIPYSSVGARAHMLLYGFELWQEKPWFGWGVGSSRSLLASDDVMKPYDHPHFHNNYLELLVEQGVFGFLFYLLAFILLMRGLFKAYAEGTIAKDIFYYLIGAWVMVLVWSLADSRMVHVDVRFALLLLSGMSFSVMLTREHSAARI